MPTVFVGVNNKMRIAQEEIFGPVVCIMPFNDDEEAIAIANDSVYGLGGGVFSNNIRDVAERIASQNKTGMCGSTTITPLLISCPSAAISSPGMGEKIWGIRSW